MVERNDDGQVKQSVSADDVLDVFERVQGPVVSSGDVADEYDVTTQTARNRLRELSDRGDVDSRRVGRTTVYWPTSNTERLRGIVRAHNERHGTDYPTDSGSLRGVLPKLLSDD